MKERSGAKKLYKANKAWVAAGLAAATLFSVSALGGNTVSAATATDGSAETQSATKTISFDFIDQDTKEVVGPTVSVTVPEHTGLTYAQLAKYLPAGYTSDFLGAYSTTTKKYYISVKKTAETKTAVGNPTAVNKEAYYDNTKKAEVGNPTAVNKEAYYDNTKKAEVGNPTAINKEAYYDNTKKAEVGNPTAINKEAYYDNTKKAEVGNPTAINKEAYYDNTPKFESKVGNPTAINKEAYYDNTPKFESKVGNPTAINKEAYYDNTPKFESKVGNPTAINKEAYYDNTPKFESKVGNPTAINKEAYYDNTPKFESKVGNPTAINKEAYYDNTPKFESKVDEPVSVTKDQLTKAGYDANGLAVTNKSTVAKTTPLANKTTGATKAATKATLPKTGDNNNVVAAGVGAVAVLGALFGLAGDRRKRA
ncbi:LPXTG cell wall anchor domain-containing protein [Lacticaseibacillus hegangensis]|uniref:LPXTG cell wall anchor domain-containing protein n=1 Tax=Lacticaseibacillus hegangensis TaxID=2486010 RepID=UPI000F78C39C|nr:LPXTG cell wall anchor domain-containing protein [Lacticaseibacillus hegangensis]